MYLKAVSTALAAARKQTGVAITYRRGELDCEIAKAGVGQTVRNLELADGLHTKVEMRDYFIAVGELVLDDQRVLPEEGDEIVEVHPEGESEVTYTYEVRPISAKEPCFRYRDPLRTEFRIHTKLIERTVE
jgi:hypothetical protein